LKSSRGGKSQKRSPKIQAKKRGKKSMRQELLEEKTEYRFLNVPKVSRPHRLRRRRKEKGSEKTELQRTYVATEGGLGSHIPPTGTNRLEFSLLISSRRSLGPPDGEKEIHIKR